MESADSSTSSQHPQLPPGFRFHPTDEELVVHYLKKKAASEPLPVAIIAEVDLYKYDPWELPAKAAFGEHEWYFFSPRDRKYPNGARPNRAATSGYWKATGTDKPVLTAGGTMKVGVKKALVFYGGKPPKGVKTNWIMHEYRIVDNKSVCKPPVYDPSKTKGSLRLDDWVLCRIYKKSMMQRPMEVDGGCSGGSGGSDQTMNGILSSPPPCMSSYSHHWLMKPTGDSTGYDAMLENDHQHTAVHTNVLFDNMLHSNAGTAVDNNIVSTSGTLPSYTKMFLTENSTNTERSPQVQATGGEENGHMGSFLNGIPGENMFRQAYQVPDMNWYA